MLILLLQKVQKMFSVGVGAFGEENQYWNRILTKFSSETFCIFKNLQSRSVKSVFIETKYLVSI